MATPRPKGPGAAGLEAPPAESLTDHPTAVRFEALDGLRGVAALVVVLFHTLLLWSRYSSPETGLRPGEVSWWLTHTPLYLLWAGPEAVFVFFVLSGFVLALPATSRRMRWRSYYPRRLVRLYVPVWGSLLFALALAALVPRVPQPGLSGWYDRHVPVQPLGETATDAVLLLGTGWINSPLWSLQWEVLFSLLLPLYLLGARVLRSWFVPKLVVLLLVIGAAWWVERSSVAYLSMFALGTLLAFERERVAGFYHRTVAVSGPRRTITVTAVVLLVASEFVLVALGQDSRLVQSLAIVAQVAGACLAVVLALHWEPAKRVLMTAPVQWIAVRSFSLYLTHEPIVVSLGSRFPDLPPWLLLPAAVVLSLLVAHVFHRLVEAPAHRLSRRAGKLL